MIILLCGLMGSGKSYEAVNFHIIPAIKEGRKVVTNIPLQVDYICAVHGEDKRELIHVLEPLLDEKGDVFNVPFSLKEHFQDDWRQEGTNIGALFVIDEAQIPLAAAQSEFNKWALSYATMQRHRGHDWILITQDPSLVYQPLIKLVTVTHKFQKCTNVGDMKSYRHFVYDGSNIGKDFCLKRETKKYDKRLFKYYKSHTESDDDVNEKNITGAFFNLKRLLFLLIMGILLAVGFVFYYFLYFVPSRYSGDEKSNSINENTIVNSINEIENLKPTFSNVVYSPSPKVKYNNAEDNDLSTEIITVKEIKHDIYKRKPIVTLKQTLVVPYDGFKFNIAGSLVFNNKKSDNFYKVWSQDGIPQDISKSELSSLGYVITVLNKCTHLFDHPNISKPFYVTCHIPLFEKENKKNKTDPNKTNMMNELEHDIK